MIKEIEKSIIDHWELTALTDYSPASSRSNGNDADSYRYADIAELIIQLHTMFREAGIQRGDKIALCGNNSSRWGIAFLATVTYGAVVVPILPDFLSDQIHHIVTHSEARLLFVSDNIQKRIEPEQMPNLLAILRVADYTTVSGSSAVPPLSSLPSPASPEQLNFQAEASEDDLMLIN